MDRKERVRVYGRFIKMEIRERLFDLAMIAIPIFIVTGLVVSSAAIWLMIWGLV